MAILSLNGQSKQDFSSVVYDGTQANRAVSIFNSNNININSCVVDGHNLSVWYVGALCEIQNASFIRFYNNNFVAGGNSGGGINFEKGCHDCSISGGIISGQNVYGIQCYGSDISQKCYNLIFSNIQITDCAKDGINIGWWSDNIVVERILARDNVNYGIIMDSAVLGCEVRNCICDGNLYNIGCGGGNQGKTRNVNFYHNTLINGIGFRINVDSGVENIQFKNNIVKTSGNNSIDVPAGVTLDYNCYFDTTGSYSFVYGGVTYHSLYDYQMATGQDSHSITVDPNLNADYTLRSDSPCINAGADVGVTMDYAGNKRGVPDIGAYEFQRTKINNARLNNCIIR